jgi:hypothetical protein
MARQQQQAKTTTDHDEIKRWAEARGGKPAAVARTGKAGDPGILRIDFPGFSGEGSLRPIGWEQFFEWFDKNELALLYRERDRFNKLVSRETAEARSRRRRSHARSRTSASKSTRRRSAGTKAARTRGAGKPRGATKRQSSASRGRSRSR